MVLDNDDFCLVGFVSYALIQTPGLCEFRLNLLTRLVTYVMLTLTTGILYVSLIFVLSNFLFS